KKIGLIIDEWGNWFDVEPGTNPGFLYQQNTMRDAIVAAINLNLFNKHCDRVKMANIAQMVNVLQSVILTEGEKMIKTPTYHVFNMYKHHQDAELVDSVIDTEEIGIDRDNMVPNLNESVSMAEDGILNITITNLSVTDSYPVEAVILEKDFTETFAELLTGNMKDHNTFDQPDAVRTEKFDKVSVDGNTLKFTIPPCSVIHISVK
ncbi:MAG: alpha-L-arabinofuranosidase C-terminal domain-containing protein, partial [Lachnospiraceae bacterium]